MQRRTSAWLTCLLILGQMLVGPLAHSAQGGANGSGCMHAAGMAGCAGDCGACPHSSGHGSPATHHGHSGSPCHARCACPSASTPAMVAAPLTWSRPGLSVELPGDIQGPAFAPPVFEFLRPPN